MKAQCFKGGGWFVFGFKACTALWLTRSPPSPYGVREGWSNPVLAVAHCTQHHGEDQTNPLSLLKPSKKLWKCHISIFPSLWSKSGVGERKMLNHFVHLLKTRNSLSCNILLTHKILNQYLELTVVGRRGKSAVSFLGNKQVAQAFKADYPSRVSEYEQLTCGNQKEWLEELHIGRR